MCARREPKLPYTGPLDFRILQADVQASEVPGHQVLILEYMPYMKIDGRVRSALLMPNEIAEKLKSPS